MTGHGGWPLNAFLTPDGVPFYAGTYFPPESRHGLPSWRMVLDGGGRGLGEPPRGDPRPGRRGWSQALSATAQLEPSIEPIRDEDLRAALVSLCGAYDRANGGFGRAPKFPPRSVIELLLARGEREMSLGTLEAMARGGIYDQVGGGFARYSVDATWTVPHFEKMLYDNALLARAYLHGWQVSGSERFRARVLRDARLGAARDAGSRGRLLLGARRRLRGRRGQVLRVDASTSCATALGADACRRRRSSTSARPSAATSSTASSPRGARARARAGASRDPRAACSRCARSASARASTTSA